MSAEKINLRQDPSSIISSEVNDNSIPKVVDINHLLARVREKEKQLDKINYSLPYVLESPELYDIESDVSEAYDISYKHSETVSKLKKKLQNHLSDTSNSLPDNLVSRIPKNSIFHPDNIN